MQFNWISAVREQYEVTGTPVTFRLQPETNEKRRDDRITFRPGPQPLPPNAYTPLIIKQPDGRQTVSLI